MLGLSGNELLTFAIIYNFSKDKSSSFRGSQGYLSECIGCSRQSVNNCLKSLVSKKYIVKETRIENNIELSSYRVNYQIIDMFDGDIDDEKVDLSKLDTLSKNLTPPVKKFDTPCQKTLHNSKEDNKHNNNIYNNTLVDSSFDELDEQEKITKKTKKSKQTQEHEILFERLWEMYPRKQGKSAVSTKAKKRLLEIGYDRLANAIQKYKEQIERFNTDIKYVKMGSTFFNGGYEDFLDDVENVNAKNNEEKTDLEKLKETDPDLYEMLRPPF